MKKSLSVIILVLLQSFAFGQGSGNALYFDGVDDYVSVGNASTLRPTSSITVEAWVKPVTMGDWVAIVGNLFDTGSNEAGYGLISNSTSGDIIFWVQTISGSSDNYNNYPSYTPTLNTWQHIAGTYDGSHLKLYANGVLINTKAKSGNIRYASPTPLDLRFGQYYDDNESTVFNGTIDEVRIWSTARTLTEIQDNMCKKLSGSETGLLGYWRMDETSGNTATDLKAAENGTLNNMAASSRLLSGAAIGDASTYTYSPASWTGQTIALSSTSNGNFEVNTVAGNPSGIQVYRVDQTPNTSAGTVTGFGTNATYYGTFFVGGSSPTYTAKYDYSNYPNAVNDQNDLVLYRKADNSVTSWTNSSATLTTATKTLIKTGMNARSEFMLASVAVPLPIEIIYFNAALNNNVVELDWAVVLNSNIDSFIVEKSMDAQHWQTLLSQVYLFSIAKYSVSDEHLYNDISYYRIKQISKDGSVDYSEIKSIDNSSETLVDLFPIPAQSFTTITSSSKISAISLFNNQGGEIVTIQNLAENATTLDLSGIVQGIYLVRIHTIDNKIITKQLIVL